MSSLQFSVRNYGTFASSNILGKSNKERMMVNYEFEFYTEDCEGGLIIDGTFHQIRQGMVSLPKPGQSVRMCHPYTCYFMNIGTTDPELQELFGSLPEMFPLWNMDEVIDHLQQMILLKPASTLNQKLRLQSHACSIIAILSHCGQNKDQAAHSAFQHRKTLLTVDRYMRSHVSEQLSLTELARMSNLDPTYFHKLYTAAFGATPAQRLLRYRIKKAKTGLLSGNISLSNLAEQCGFSSQTYFCYKFRKATGMTPTQYREQMLSRMKNE